MSQKSTSMGEPTNSVFQRSWWLDAVAPGQWSSIEIEEGGRVCARMPVVERRKCGMRLLTMPKLTQTLGPWLAATDSKPNRRIAQEKKWLTTLVDRLPNFDYFCQNWHYSMRNWLPFHWRGFQCSTALTYVLEDLTDLDAVWAGYQDTTRRQIRKARKQVAVVHERSLDDFWGLTEKTYQRQRLHVPYSRNLLERVDAACINNGARRIFFAEDAGGNVHAALYLVWDDTSAYYLIGGSDERVRGNGAMSLLMHEAICFASKVTRRFDFEGSMVEPIERFLRAFGGTPQVYFRVHGFSRRMNVVQGFRDMFRRSAG